MKLYNNGMISEQLKSYIQEARKSGKTSDEIRQFLLGAGWQELDITEALSASEPTYPPILPETSIPVTSGTKLKMAGFFNSLKTRIKRPQTYYVLGAILLILAAIFLYQKIVLKEELSEFELIPQVADAAGIIPNTTFTLK